MNVQKSEELFQSTWMATVETSPISLSLPFLHLLQGLSEAHDLGSGIGLAMALVASYYMAGKMVMIHDENTYICFLFSSSQPIVMSVHLRTDLGTGVYHWIVDNYGDGNTPVLGRQIEAFTSHHRYPWTITKRQFANNVHLVFKPVLPFAATLCLAAPVTPGWWDVWSSSFMFLICMSQQFHAWSHMKKSELPEAVDWLQSQGLLVSRRDHGQHHKAPFEGHYCIVSGFWNPILDQNGSDDAFFRQLERLVHKVTGVEPRCWSMPDFATPDYYGPGVSVSESVMGSMDTESVE